MRICLACYEDRLASVFENAVDYKFFEIFDDGNIYPAGHLSLPSKDPTDRTSAILACGVSYLICGAICGTTKTAIEAAGLKCAPFLKGRVDEVLDALGQGRLNSLSMPGCNVGKSFSCFPV
ncbi:MAG: dinitrogenase iron-molybdenum cofactor biosynthesis protein [Proteobacteria bacterium]|nr:dinitrogenase iron-molybdenum cofactor biosynthesis protein [Pseudomonadota bacterium]MBU1611194.1 dinitrogenase iron-molybdenum cofactor biosynthesis protein [Pseudomonadota bacterium]